MRFSLPCSDCISLPPFLQTAGYSYSCVISSTGSELMATVDANSSVTCQLPSGGIAITEAERVTRVELQWRIRNSDNTFSIETSRMEQLSECMRIIRVKSNNLYMSSKWMSHEVSALSCMRGSHDSAVWS